MRKPLIGAGYSLTFVTSRLLSRVANDVCAWRKTRKADVTRLGGTSTETWSR